MEPTPTPLELPLGAAGETEPRAMAERTSAGQTPGELTSAAPTLSERASAGRLLSKQAPAERLPAAPAAAPTCGRAEVLVGAPVGILDYAIPAAWEAPLRPGMAVQVPLGNRQLTGYILACYPDANGKDGVDGGAGLKPLSDVDPDQVPLPMPLLDLLRFAARYYRVTPGEMLQAALPRAARDSAQRYFALPAAAEADLPGAPKLRPAQRAALQLAQSQSRGFSVVALQRLLQGQRATAQRHLRSLCALGYLARRAPPTKRRQQACFGRIEVPGPAAVPLSARQQAAAELLARLPPASAAVPLEALGSNGPQLRRQLLTLVKQGLAERTTREVVQDPFPEAAALAAAAAPPPTLTADQQVALHTLEAAVQAGGFAAHLLHGVTGSGKTEVYLRAIAATLEAGRTALVLVPEIALTPQLGAAFRARFGAQVATFHSGLTDAQRRDEYDRVHTGSARIGLGARSALFLPLRNLGMLIVDEEHEGSFKQDEAPRYHARDLAVRRAQLEGAVIVLGSATPSLETHQNASKGRYVRLSLPRRVADRPLPEVEAIDLRQQARGDDGVFTPTLLEQMERALSADEQIILFLNRRGFAPYVFCRDCGHSYRCVSCDVSLTLHRKKQLLCCHYCGHQVHAPESCGACSSHRVGTHGLGTEQVAQAVQAHFPTARSLRLDRDVVRNKKHLEEVLGGFRRREAQILIGTQMVTKGHDFPQVTLVGVVAADASLNFPDFRAAERTFQLLTQVAGRAGRGSKPGKVFAQAYETEHYALRAAMHHDYAAFVEIELQHRRELLYPPFAHLALLRISGPQEHEALQQAQQWADRLRQRGHAAGLPTTILGPAPAPLARLRERFRFTILLKAANRSDLHASLALGPPAGRAGIEQVTDVDPCHML
jgi:primosomal protein N' (replication factor Y)